MEMTQNNQKTESKLFKMRYFIPFTQSGQEDDDRQALESQSGHTGLSPEQLPVLKSQQHTGALQHSVIEVTCGQF